MISCECGCGQAIPAMDSRGRPRRFSNGHNGSEPGTRRRISETLKDRPKTPEHAAKVGAALRGTKRPQTHGENNSAWLGDAAGYHAKHKWINYHHPKTGVCEHCGGESRDYANVSGDYRRDRSDWLELCVPCHKRFDVLTKESNA